MRITAAIVGGGPAGLMAAEVLGAAGVDAHVFDAMPTLGRKFLMAGKSGLNLTMDVGPDQLVQAYGKTPLNPMIQAFDAEAVKAWGKSLGQELFTGSTGRVFPKVMKASPLLRAWLARLEAQGATRHMRWRWTGWDDDVLVFQTPEGPKRVMADVTILALGGASWARLGSDGLWGSVVAQSGIALAPFAPANAALAVRWSDHMRLHLGQPVKAVTWKAGALVSRGEGILSDKGLEGGGIYSISKAVRDGTALYVDLLPDLTAEQVAAKLSQPKRKASLTNHLRKKLSLGPVKLALLQEWGRPVPADPADCAALLKNLPVRHDGLRPMDEAISTTGGVPFDALDADLMLTSRPGTYCVGEMLDWEAPTGGYLITGCLATGRWAGHAAVRRMSGAVPA